MAEKKEKDPEFNSPRGVFRYPALDKPDYGSKKFQDPEGSYKTDLILPLKVAQPLIDKLTPLHEAAVEAAREEFSKLKVETRKKLKDVTVNEFYSEEFDKETEEPTGNVIFRFKRKASGKRKDGTPWKITIPVFDAKGKPLKKVPEIWGGSEGAIRFAVKPYFIPGTAACGVNLKLLAAQLIELRQGGGRDAEGYGFGEEDGYQAEEEQEQGSDFQDETGGEADSDEF